MEVKNDDGDTPLLLAVRSEHPAVVDVLCKRGCNMHAHGFDNLEPIEYALNKRNPYISEVLLKHEKQHSTGSNSASATTTTTLHQNQSLTTLLHEQQEEHFKLEEQNQNQSANDSSIFSSD